MTDALQAEEQVDAFSQRFGAPTHAFVMHAALPLALTPDLLYLMRASFPLDQRGRRLEVPWEAVADVLLSPLCQQVGAEVYEMDAAVRRYLVARLRLHGRFGPQRIEDLARFLDEYVRQQLDSPNPHQRALAQAQRWTALAHRDPDAAVVELAGELTRAPQDYAHMLRLARVVESLEQPLQRHRTLLEYSRVMMESARGRLSAASPAAQYLVSRMDAQGALYVAGVPLPLPEQVQGVVRPPPPPDRGPVRVFIHAAPEDRELQEELERHLVSLQISEQITVASLRSAGLGHPVVKVIERGIEEAELILVLISHSFLSDKLSKFFIELAMARLATGSARVVPVLLTPCDLSDSPLVGIVGLPRNGKSVSQWNIRDAAWVEVTSELLSVINDIRTRPLTRQGSASQVSPRQDAPPVNRSSERGKANSIKVLFTRRWINAKSREPGAIYSHIVDRVLAYAHPVRLDFLEESFANPSELNPLILRHRPAILQFTDIESSAAQGETTEWPTPLTSKILDGVIGSIRGFIPRCVLFIGGRWEREAQQVSEFVDCVIGLFGEVHEGEASAFAFGFYAGLGEGMNVQAAFERGIAERSLQYRSSTGRPLLLLRPGVEPGAMLLSS